MHLQDFLRTVITTDKGYFCLAAAAKDHPWKEYFFEWPAEVNEIVYKAKELADADLNVYFSAHLFATAKSTKSNVLPTRTIQADLDYASSYNSPIPPTILVETSPQRYQAYWILKDEPTPAIVEDFSRRLTYAIPDCDKTGWPLGHRLRVPSTNNFKYEPAHYITVQSVATKRLDLELLETLPEVDNVISFDEDIDWVNQPHTPLNIPPLELIHALARDNKISAIVRHQFSHLHKDRSGALWRLMLELFAAQLTRDLVYWLAFNSANNKYTEREYNGIRDLRKDVLRAEAHDNNKGSDIKSRIREVRKDENAGTVTERLTIISDFVIKHMQQHGTFYHTKDNKMYYVKTIIGRPMEIPMFGYRCVWLNTLLTWDYGLNSSMQDAHYVMTEIQAFARQMPPTTEEQVLSYYEAQSKTMLLYTGMKELVAITTHSINHVPNGSSDILFVPPAYVDPFRLENRELPMPWWDLMFKSTFIDKQGSTIQNLTPEEAIAILAVWIMFLLFRAEAVTKPVVAILGQPGSGKSAMMSKVYRLLYSPHRTIHQITDEDDWDIATSRNPLVCYDNLDSYIKWVVERLATAAGNSSVEKRVLYTDSETIVLRRDALVGVTAHSPKFIREDIADRLIVINLRRRDKESFLDEKEILEEVSRNRGAIWNAIVQDVQRVINTPRPNPSEVPAFRIKDFASLGVWISRGIGLETDFKRAIEKVVSSQSSLVIEDDFSLVQAIRRWINKYGRTDFISVTTLWNELSICADDVVAFNRTYKNTKTLGGKLWTMQTALKGLFNVDYKIDGKSGSRLWRLTDKEVELDG